jgi:hypothetical protein
MNGNVTMMPEKQNATGTMKNCTRVEIGVLVTFAFVNN